MTTFEKYRKHCRERFLENLPGQVRYQARKLLREADSLEGMPDAELTPELVELRNLEMEFARSGFETTIQKGRILLELKRRLATETAFWQHVTEKLKTSREDAELAMEAAQEQT